MRGFNPLAKMGDRPCMDSKGRELAGKPPPKDAGRRLQRGRKMIRKLLMVAGLAWISATSPAAASEPLVIVGFNAESDEPKDTTPELVADDIKQIAAGVDVYVFTEVESPAVAELFRKAAADASGTPLDMVVSKTGGTDRIAIVWNSARFAKVRSFELEGTYARVCRTEDNRVPRFRGTPVVILRSNATRKEFWVSGSHFQRDVVFNTCQAQELAKFAAKNKAPHIAVGDFNFDWSLKQPEGSPGQRRDGYAELTDKGPFQWIRPSKLIPTYCSTHKSVLDFHFVTNGAKGWGGKATILFPEAAYCDKEDKGYSDHRPVRADFAMP